MIKRRTILGLMASSLLPLNARAAFTGAASLDAEIKQGKLPDISGRLPRNPRVVNLGAKKLAAGQHGGVVRMLIGGQRDIRLMPINSYSRLVGYDEQLNLHADILESFDAQDDRIFTFKLREGHKWSSGSPLTSEDFRYAWEDVMNNRDLHRGGIPVELRVNGKGPRFEMVDALTVRYSWEEPNPDFLAQLASPTPLLIAMPSAYLKQFHPKYQSAEELARLIKQYRVEDWDDLHKLMSRTVRPENPDLPTLDPWYNTTKPPSGQFIFKRNAYFHRVDENGLQLPYIDQMTLDVSSPDLIAAKAGSGESDLQMANVDFSDYTFLKAAEKRFPLTVDLWKRTQGSRVALIPNLNCKDDVWRKVFQDVRVRRALSLGINRQEINKAVFFGLAHEAGNSVLPDSPLFKREYEQAWASHDVDQANRLLDEAGLANRNDDGLRLLPDGRVAKIIIESAGESTFESDVLELITDHWLKIGIAIFTRVSQREIFRKRVIGGETVMGIWMGLDNGVPTADMSPKELAPTFDDQLQWPVWGLHYLSGGTDGHPPDLPEAIELLELMKKWKTAGTYEQREAIWHSMLEIFTSQVFTIGIVNQSLQPLVKSSKLQNIPENGLFGYDPTSYLGVYMPDTFWYKEDQA
ncbi:ABC transporter substrate-binding protein [Neorhizobium sp. NCHU2750]|uniref:ABC transporter substrate-binding protein n=1 Tax=Neorhizobium sp. NCHU2750 TaxID=1825976 RepID=UPI000E735367|nr:peptide/nickel ABC transporter substrate-binding protein [Neorhizobium sp. NCHU2750]